MPEWYAHMVGISFNGLREFLKLVLHFGGKK